jgi:hypothetical protein
MDAVVAAPDSHRVLLDDDRARVLEVTVGPETAEPVHTHRLPSLMVVLSPARIRYFEGERGDQFRYESPHEPRPTVPRAHWMPPEGPHRVENIDQIPYRAIRVELKDG